MKIILATPVYPPEISGPAVYIKELALKLRDAHEVTIVAYASTSERIEGTTLFTISKRRPLPFRLVKYFLTLYKASRGADVIYVQNAMAAGLPAVLVGKIRKIPVVIKFIDDEVVRRGVSNGRGNSASGGLFAKLRMALQGFVLRQADIVAMPSLYVRDTIVKRYGIKNDRAIVNYIAAIFDPEAPFPATPKPHQIITITGSNREKSEEKGLDGIIRAVSILKNKYPDVRAVIASEGEISVEEKIKALAIELKVVDQINFTDHISRTETLHLRKSSEVYVLNSTHEETPNAALLAFNAGIPIVATDIPATDEAVYDSVSGLLVPKENDDALTLAIEKLFDDKGLREKLVKGGVQILKEKFSWETHLKNLLGIFGQI